jgi:acid phosphatase type 7
MPRTWSKLWSVLLAIGIATAALPTSATESAEPPRFEVPAREDGHALTFLVYGDTRFTRRDDVVNASARRALVERMAHEQPAAVLIGGDLVYQGAEADDYQVYKSETVEWSNREIPVFPTLGNHEFKGCTDDVSPCLENWWNTFTSLRPYRWYSVTIGGTLRVVMLDSDAHLRPGSEQRTWFEQQISSANADPRIKFILIMLHYPPVRDPFYPAMLDEKEVARYLAKRTHALRVQVVVVGSHVHNYERYSRNGVTYLVSGGGGAKPVPAVRMFGELSKLHTSVNYHYIRFSLESDRLIGTMVRFEAAESSADPWSEPDRFEVRAKH